MSTSSLSTSGPLQCQIQAASGDDAAALSELALRSKAYWGYDPDFMNRCRGELTWSAEQINAVQFDFQVCRLDKQPVAFYALERIDAEIMELEAMFVEPEKIGRGIGRLMMQHAKSRAVSLGAKRMIIQGDPHAVSFYLATGAIPCGSRESCSIPGRQLPLFELMLGTREDDVGTGK